VHKPCRALLHSPELDFVVASLTGAGIGGGHGQSVASTSELEDALQHGLTCLESVWLQPGRNIPTLPFPTCEIHSCVLSFVNSVGEAERYNHDLLGEAERYHHDLLAQQETWIMLTHRLVEMIPAVDNQFLGACEAGP